MLDYQGVIAERCGVEASENVADETHPTHAHTHNATSAYSNAHKPHTHSPFPSQPALPYLQHLVVRTFPGRKDSGKVYEDGGSAGGD